MFILLTNDDGIYAQGLWAMYSRLAEDHHVVVVAPDREKSASSHSITLHEPLRVMKLMVHNRYEGHAINGTPVDCVKLAIAEILEEKPDMVISGINPGANVGASINYSGTVAAAREAALYGIPSFAISIDGFEMTNLDCAAGFGSFFASRISGMELPFGSYFNVNVPDLPCNEIEGVRVSIQGITMLQEFFEKRVDPRNRDYHWLSGGYQRFDEEMESGIDGSVLSNRHVSITPLKCDATDYALMERMKQISLDDLLRKENP